MARIFSRIRTLSTIAAFTTAAIFGGMSLVGMGGSAEWQVWLALIALAVGIPHGAMDHLVTVPSMQPARMTAFILGYLSVVALAIIAILLWNVVGFVLVVMMSAVHFGIGDAAFTQELNRHRNWSAMHSTWWVYAIPAGALPVVIPLTSSQADLALELVNPALQNWHQGLGPVVFWSTLLAGAGAVSWLLVRRQYRSALDLVALGALALLAPPLVAFSVYFGLWHAQRHTARLVLELPRAIQLAQSKSPAAGFWAAVVPGLPALVGTMVVAAGLTGWTGGEIQSDFLWITLVIVWALTVPHMALTWRLDRKALRSPPSRQLA